METEVDVFVWHPTTSDANTRAHASCAAAHQNFERRSLSNTPPPHRWLLPYMAQIPETWFIHSHPTSSLCGPRMSRIQSRQLVVRNRSNSRSTLASGALPPDASLASSPYRAAVATRSMRQKSGRSYGARPRGGGELAGDHSSMRSTRLDPLPPAHVGLPPRLLRRLRDVCGRSGRIWSGGSWRGVMMPGPRAARTARRRGGGATRRRASYTEQSRAVWSKCTHQPSDPIMPRYSASLGAEGGRTGSDGRDPRERSGWRASAAAVESERHIVRGETRGHASSPRSRRESLATQPEERGDRCARVA
jgi:hypothetical protein